MQADVQKSLPLYEQLSWALYEVGQARAYFLKKKEALDVEASIAGKLENVALVSGLELPKVLAGLTGGYGHYMAGNNEEAVNSALESLRHPIILTFEDWTQQPLQILRTKGIGAAKRGDREIARQATQELRELAGRTADVRIACHALEGVARIEAILRSKAVWQVLDEVAAVRIKEGSYYKVQSSRMMEIRAIFEAMYYCREPDKGYVEKLWDEAILIAGDSKRHMEQIKSGKAKVLALRKSSWRPRLWRGFSASLASLIRRRR